MEDGEPTVVFSRPGRDTRVTLVDEVYLEAEAVDDFGATDYLEVILAGKL